MKWIPIHELLNAMGPARASGIMYFHAFTRCDVVSAFRGKGNKAAWRTWDVFDEVTETFSKLSHFPTEVRDTDLKTLERFVLMYAQSSAATGVDEARLHMFARKQRPYDSIPPTQAALREHAKPAAYHVCVKWGPGYRPSRQAARNRPNVHARRANAFVLKLPVQHSATARVNNRTVRETTVFQLVQYMCSNGQLSNILYRFACGCRQQFDASHMLLKLL